MMKLATCVCVVSLLGAVACAGSEPASEMPESTATAGAEMEAAGGEASAEQAAEATEPDHQKLVAHFKQHVQYPTDRAKILEACAKTSEFSDGEKAWVEQNLPEGEYESSDDLIGAMGL